jgi:heat shock protein HtpX
MSTQAPVRLPKMFTDKATGERINLLAWKAANIRLSFLLALFIFALLIAIAYLLALVFEPESAYLFIGASLLIATVQNVVAYWFSDKIALNVAGARPATLEENRYLVHITEAVAIGAGVPMPKLYVIDSPAPNAFATGRNPKHGTVVVSKGLLDLLDRQELEGVIAHEISHIKHFDILFMTMLMATVGAIVVLRDFIWRSLRYSGRGRSRRDNDGQGQAIAYVMLLALLLLAPILAMLLRFAVSRRREFLADATGAYLTLNPEGLASALEKLRDYRGEKLEVSEGIQHLFFTNPVSRFNARGLLATHPPIEERIARLRRM